MINLNGSEFNSPVVAIFNNGVAGRVDNVSISVEKKKPEDNDLAPAYKVIFTDATGSINMGIYYPTDQSTDTQKQMLAKKCSDLVKSVMGDDFVFPEFSNYNELVDQCMRIIAQNCSNAKVNVMATYGTAGAPKKYLGVYKNYNFVEKTGTTPTKLRVAKNPNKPQYDDLFERIVEDVPTNDLENTTSNDSKSTNDWL